MWKMDYSTAKEKIGSILGYSQKNSGDLEDGHRKMDDLLDIIAS